MRDTEDNQILQLFEMTKYPNIKEELFRRLFPDIKDIEKWILIFPEKLNRNGELNYLCGYEWSIFSNHVESILVIDPDSAWEKACNR